MKRLRMARSVVELRRGRTDWYRIENKAGNPEVYIYDEIGYFGVTSDDFVKDLQAIDSDLIDLHLNSPGGDVFAGIAILNCLRDHKARVHVSVDGVAASAASFIAMAGDEITMARNSEMMIHDARSMCAGSAEDMRDLAVHLDRVSDNIASVYAERAGGEVSEWRERMRKETWYSAQEAVDAGLADKVAAKPGAEADNTWDLSIYNYAGRDKAPQPAVQKKSVFDYDSVVAALKGAGQ